MIKKSINSKKGITLISLVLTIIILLILATTVINGIISSNETSVYNTMLADITLLEDKILVYYNKYGEIPTTSREIFIDAIVYKEIDLSKLDNLTLNYGKEYGNEEALEQDVSDVYIINNNMEVYYLKGIEKSGIVYHED